MDREKERAIWAQITLNETGDYTLGNRINPYGYSHKAAHAAARECPADYADILEDQGEYWDWND